MDLTPIILVTILLLIIAIGIIMLVLVYQKKQLQFLNEREQLKVAFEKEILESRLEIQEQTMKNISQEIHDNIGQVLSLVKLNLNSMNCNDQQALQERIKDSSLLVRQAIQDLRDLSKSLHTDIIKEKGLIRSIENEFELLKKAGGYKTTIIQEGTPFALSHQHELILFRVFQEVLNNIIKHAHASMIMVKICYSDLFELEIKDDGQGFDSSYLNENHQSGLGIRNMRNRTRVIGADFSINSETGSGTSVKICLPVPTLVQKN